MHGNIALHIEKYIISGKQKEKEVTWKEEHKQQS